MVKPVQVKGFLTLEGFLPGFIFYIDNPCWLRKKYDIIL